MGDLTNAASSGLIQPFSFLKMGFKKNGFDVPTMHEGLDAVAIEKSVEHCPCSHGVSFLEDRWRIQGEI